SPGDGAHARGDRAERRRVQLAAELLPAVVAGLVPELGEVVDDDVDAGGQVRRELVLPRRSEVPGKAPQPLPVAVELEVRPAVLHPLAVDRVARGQEVELRDRLARTSAR